jgi:hypothetical protein
MKNMTNTLNKLTKFLAVAIISVSLNAFSSVVLNSHTIAKTFITPVTITNTGVSTVNLAFGKPATQSSNYYETDRYQAPQAVNGDTRGVWYTNSITHTKYEQGAWWQVDLGNQKNIKKIVIYNRTDCCADRLSNYQVSISNKADFSTHIYQQDFHVSPNPKKIIQLDASGKQGRYVRIQLLDKDYLSLAEVQVMGVDPLRFAEMDFSSAHNNFGGFHNAPNYPNLAAFSTLKANGSITAWGDPDAGGTAPSGSGYTKIYSTRTAFAALKADGSITAWGSGSTGAPSDSGYTKIYSTYSAFAALKADGSITAWGVSGRGGSDAPAGNGYTKIYSTGYAFATLKADGSITAWGNSGYGGSDAPDGKGYTKIYSTSRTFAALKADGSIKAWGYGSEGTDAPAGNGYTKIYSTYYAFAALKADGSITAWGDSEYGGSGAPTDSGYAKIYSNGYAFASVKADGSITAWGDPSRGGTTPASD